MDAVFGIFDLFRPLAIPRRAPPQPPADPSDWTLLVAGGEVLVDKDGLALAVYAPQETWQSFATADGVMYATMDGKVYATEGAPE